MNKPKLSLTSAMAATLVALPACSSNDDWDDNVYAQTNTRVCVDQNGQRITDEGCRSGTSNYYGGGRWYYFGPGARIPYYGDSVHNRSQGFSGSFQPANGVNYANAPAHTQMTRSAAVSRGGFGSRGRSYGGGWS